MVLLWHELFMIKMTFCSHINSKGEGGHFALDSHTTWHAVSWLRFIWKTLEASVHLLIIFKCI